jgi:hypothetical protein
MNIAPSIFASAMSYNVVAGELLAEFYINV